MFVSAAIRPNLQPALRKQQNRSRCSELELRGPKSGLNMCTRSSRGVRSALCLAQNLNLTTSLRVGGVRGRERPAKHAA
eukprot:9880060-Alexandrium_andersonii.AAC.1